MVPVMVNGHGPFIMLLDTGATHSAISEDVAAIAGARAVAKSTVISPVGETVRAIVSIDRLVVGPISADNVLPSVVPAGSFDAEGKIHGLIGQDVLARLRYTLDFKRRVVEWHDEAPPRRGHRAPPRVRTRPLSRQPAAATTPRCAWFQIAVPEDWCCSMRRAVRVTTS